MVSPFLRAPTADPLYLARVRSKHHLVTCQMRRLALAFLSNGGDPTTTGRSWTISGRMGTRFGRCLQLIINNQSLSREPPLVPLLLRIRRARRGDREAHTPHRTGKLNDETRSRCRRTDHRRARLRHVDVHGENSPSNLKKKRRRTIYDLTLS